MRIRQCKHTKSDVYRRFDLFGWIFYVSRVPLSVRARAVKKRKISKQLKFKLLDGQCQHCGRQMGKYVEARYHSHLAPDCDQSLRWAPENCIMLCPECNSGYQLAKERGLGHWSAIDIEKAVANAGFGGDVANKVIKELAALDHDITKYYARMAVSAPEDAAAEEGGEG